MSEPEPVPPYTDSDLFAEFGWHWSIYWQSYLDGRQIVADDRLDPSVTFTRRTPAELRDVLRVHETGRAARERDSSAR